MSSSTPFRRPRINIGYGSDHPDGVTSLPDLVDWNAKHNPDHIFGLQSRTGEQSPCEITFRQLRKAVENGSSWLVHSGATPGRISRETTVSPVAILLGSDIGIFMYIAALTRIGTPVLCLSARLTPVAIAHLLAKTSPSIVLISPQVARAASEAEALYRADEQNPDIIFTHAPSYAELLSGPSVGTVPPKYIDYRYGDRDAIIMHSSGTTGLPKPIYHAQAYILTYATNHELEDQAYDFNVSTLPLYHGFGLLAPSLSLSVGMPFVLPPASAIPTARSTLQALTMTQARSMFSVPSILEDMLRLPDGDGVKALKGLEFVVIGGAPMKESVAEELIAHGVRLLNHWGATELGAIASVRLLPVDYDWHYIIPRKDLGLRFDRAEDGETFRVSGQAPGWDEPFVVQDLLVMNPHEPSQYRIMGRADDLLVLATGEKVRPAGLEQSIAEHPRVKAVLAFGDGRDSMGVVVELAGDSLEVDETFWVYLERGNDLTDKHGKVAREMVLFTSEGTKPLLRTDKGSLQKKANLALFEDEINKAYDLAGSGKAIPFVHEGGVRAVLRNLVSGITGAPEYSEGKADASDFFETGMDSLQATRLRRAILSGMRATPDLPRPIKDIESDFCFLHSTLDKLTWAVTRLLQGIEDSKPVSKADRLQNMEQMVEKYRSQLLSLGTLAREVRGRKRRVPPESAVNRKIVLLTGSTGSLGCFLLARLLSDETVEKVICVNRQKVGEGDAMSRQRRLMTKRGAVVSEDAWTKVKMLECELSTLEWTDPESIRVTHIIHNAWPVNFNRHISSFESHVASLVNLIKLSIMASEYSLEAPRVLFASSIAVAGRYPVIHPDSLEIPETPVGPLYTAEFGYPEAKWVCEQIVGIADQLYGHDGLKLMRGSCVRIGQMTGAEGAGAWNESEHFPIIIRSSKIIQALPSVEGSLSWMPVNRAGNAIVELAFSERFLPVYHMENPSRQSWSGILQTVSLTLGLPVVPFAEWMEKVRALGDKTPASKVLNFLERDFMRLATGTVVLSTMQARRDSKQMATSGSLDKRHIAEYLAYWDTVG